MRSVDAFPFVRFTIFSEGSAVRRAVVPVALLLTISLASCSDPPDEEPPASDSVVADANNDGGVLDVTSEPDLGQADDSKALPDTALEDTLVDTTATPDSDDKPDVVADVNEPQDTGPPPCKTEKDCEDPEGNPCEPSTCAAGACTGCSGTQTSC